MKTTKSKTGIKALSLFLSVLMMFSCFSVCIPGLAVIPAFAADTNAQIVDSGYCGVNIVWTLDDNGVLTISGSGDMQADYVAPWEASKVNSIVFDGDITSISYEAFAYTNITEATIPDSVTFMGYDSFSYCDNLTTVHIGKGLENGDSNFDCCPIETFTVDPENEYYEVIDGALVYTSYYYDWELEEDVAVKCLVKTDRTGRIPDCDIKEMWYGCISNISEDVTSLTIPESVFFYNNPIEDCAGLEEITFLCNTDEFDICISDCPKLDSFNFSEVSERYQVVDGALIDTYNNALCRCARDGSYPTDGSFEYIAWGAFDALPADVKSITIPSCVASIDNPVAVYCPYLEEIILPEAIENISTISYKCPNLKSIVIPETNEYYRAVGSAVISKEDNRLVCSEGYDPIPADAGIEYIGGYAISLPDDMTSLTIPEGISELGYGSISEGLTLKEINIPASVEYIDSFFYDTDYCPCVTDVHVSEDNEYYYSLNNCIIEKESGNIIFSTKEYTLPENENVTGIADYAFSNRHDLYEIYIPANIRSLGTGAFEGSNLISVSFAHNGNLTNIGDGCFNNTNIQTIKIPYGVTDIGSSAIPYADYIEIPDTVENFGKYPFSYLKNAEDILDIIHGEPGYCKFNDVDCVNCPESYKNIFLYNECGHEKDYIADVVNNDDGTRTYNIKLTCPDCEETVYETSYIGNRRTKVTSETGLSTIDNGYIVDCLGSDNSAYNVITIEEIEVGPSEENEKVLKTTTLYIVDNRAASYFCNDYVRCVINDGNIVELTTGESKVDDYVFDIELINRKYNEQSSYQVDIYHIENAHRGEKIFEKEIFLNPYYVEYNGQWGTNGVWEYHRNGTLVITGTGTMGTENDGDEKGCDFTEVVEEVVVDGFDNIPPYAFYDGKYCFPMHTVIIGDSIKHIDDCAFQGNHFLRKVIGGDNVETIGGYAFYDCSRLDTVNIGEKVSFIGTHAFDGCGRIENFTASPRDTIVGFEDDKTFSNFYEDRNVSIISNSIHYDNIKDFGQCGDNLFWSLDGFTLTLSGEGSMWDYTSCEDTPWNKYKGVINIIKDESTCSHIGNNAFSGLFVLSECSFNDSLSSIGSKAIPNLFQLHYFYLGSNVVELGEYAFVGLSSRDATEESIIIEPRRDQLNYTATSFHGNSEYFASNEAWRVAKAGKCGENLDYELSGTGALHIFGTGDMYDYDEISAPWSEDNVTSVKIDDGVTSIGNGAFKANSFKYAILGEDIEKIGSEAFYETGLKYFNIPISVEVIGDRAFAKNSARFISVPKQGYFRASPSKSAVGTDMICHSYYFAADSNFFTDMTIGEDAFYDCLETNPYRYDFDTLLYSQMIFGDYFDNIITFVPEYVHTPKVTAESLDLAIKMYKKYGYVSTYYVSSPDKSDYASVDSIICLLDEGCPNIENTGTRYCITVGKMYYVGHEDENPLMSEGGCWYSDVDGLPNLFSSNDQYTFSFSKICEEDNHMNCNGDCEHRAKATFSSIWYSDSPATRVVTVEAPANHIPTVTEQNNEWKIGCEKCDEVITVIPKNISIVIDDEIPIVDYKPEEIKDTTKGYIQDNFDDIWTKCEDITVDDDAATVDIVVEKKYKAPVKMAIKTTTPVTYTVTYVTDGNGIITAENTVSEIVSGTEYDTAWRPTYTANDGYVFDHYENEPDVIDGNKTITLVFVPAYSVTYITDGNGVITGNDTVTDIKGGTPYDTNWRPAYEANDGYIFAGYESEPEVINQNETVKLLFEPVYTVTYITDGNGVITGNDTVTGIKGGTPYDTDWRPAFTANIGYAFDYYEDEPVIVDGNKTVILHFKRNAYTVTYVAKKGGTITGEAVIANIPAGTAYTTDWRPAYEEASGYHFDGYSTEPDVINSDVTIVLKFKADPAKTIVFFAPDRVAYEVTKYGLIIDNETLRFDEGTVVRFKPRVNYDDNAYIVYINEKPIEADSDGWFTVPGNVTYAMISLTPAVENKDTGEKTSWWEILAQFFMKIIDFFRNLFK